ISCRALVAAGSTEEQRVEEDSQLRSHLAFYGSTPAYRGVLELHGWGPLQGELNRLLKARPRTDMAGLLDDEILDAFALRSTVANLPGLLTARFGDVADRIVLPGPYGEVHAGWIDQ